MHSQFWPVAHPFYQQLYQVHSIDQKWSHSKGNSLIALVLLISSHPSLTSRPTADEYLCLGAYLDVLAHRVYHKIRTRSSGSVRYMWVLRLIDLGNLFLHCFFFYLFFFYFINSPFKIKKSVFFDKVLSHTV